MTAALAALALWGGVCGCKGTDGKEEEEKAEAMETAIQKLNENYVDTMTLHKVVFRKQIKCNGKLRAAAKSELAMQATGVLHDIRVRNGQRVAKGALLASADKTDARRELEKARQDMEKARVDLVDKLIGQGYDESMEGVPEQILQRAKVTSGYASAEYALQTARINLERCDLHAPFAGRVADMDCKLYQQPGEKFCTLIDDSQFDVEFSVLEAELQSVAVGQEVVVSPFVDEERTFEGRVTEINPSIDEKGQVKVRARIRNRDGALMEGMNVRVVVEKDVPDMFVVPKDAVLMRDGFHVLFRYRDGRAVWTYVDVVYSNISSYAVTGSRRKETEIREGDVVITSGNLNLADGTEVIPRKGTRKE